MSKPLHRLSRKARRLRDIAAFCRRVNPPWHPDYLRTLHRALRLCKKDRFVPAEAFRLGLFRPDRDREGASPYVSRKRLTKAQEKLNPAGWAGLLKNKDVFYRHCMALDVPIPRLYAVADATSPGWSCAGRPLATPDDWHTFFRETLPGEFAVKPAVGAYGQGFNLFCRVDGHYVDAFQAHLKADALYETLVSTKGMRYIIQERLHNHAALVQLSGTEMLQTVRMITLVDDNGDVRLLHAHLKVIEADEIVDTFLRGLKGNIEAPVALNAGRLQTANRIPGTGGEVVTVPVHPKTKTAFAGLELPFWSEARRLVERTALLFLPVRTIGWDVALTPNGPMIVEGNVWWDPPNQHGDMEMLLRRLDSCGSCASKDMKAVFQSTM